MSKKISIFLLLLIFGILLNSSITYAADFEMKLNENWRFYNGQLINKSDELIENTYEVNLPIEFDEIKDSNSNYGTFIKILEIDESLINSKLGLELPYVYSAATIFVNGEKIGEVGKVGTNAKNHVTSLKTIVVPLVTTSKTLEIAIQISSFDHIRGGFSGAPTIGEWESINNSYIFERYIALFIATIILIVGLATLTIGILNKNEKIFFVFGLFASVVAIRSLVAVPFLYHNFPINISYELATKIEYITTTVCFALYALFIYILYNKLFSKAVLYFNVTVLLAIAVLTVFTAPKVFQSVFFSVFPFMILFVIYNIWIMVKAYRNKLKLAKPLLLGVLFVLLGLVIDFLSGMGIISIPPTANFMITLNVLLVLFSLCQNYVRYVETVKQLNNHLDVIVRKRTQQLNMVNNQLKRQLNLDALTGIYNRHKFNESIYEEFQRSKDEKKPLSLMMLDLDEFKTYNDYYGHVSGDDLIKHVVNIVKNTIPKDVMFARYGGEEFAIILPNYTLDQTKVIAEEIRLNVEKEKLESLGASSKIVTVSIGCAERMKDFIRNEREFIQIADERLYYSKENGRNTVTSTSKDLIKLQ